MSSVSRADEEPVLRLKRGVEWHPLDDEIVVLDLNSSAYLAVNDTGAVLWPLVAQGTTEGQLVEALTSRFQIDAGQARADAGVFVEQLRSLTLVEEA